MTYLSNAFSLNMISGIGVTCNVKFSPISAGDVPATVVSAIGHPDTAAVVSSDLGMTLAANRVNVALDKGDTLYVAQYIGARLPEGATKLPEGAIIKYFKVDVLAD